MFVLAAVLALRKDGDGSVSGSSMVGELMSENVNFEKKRRHSRRLDALQPCFMTFV